MPSYHRAKIINEVRSAHFTLGSRSPVYSTTNQAHFKESPPSKQSPVAHSNKSHIQISSNNCSSPYTESVAKYRSYSEEPKVKINKPSPSLHLSQSPGSYVTTSLTAYKKLGSLQNSNAKSYKITQKNVRGHNFDLGCGNFREYKSAMHNDFVQFGKIETIPNDKAIKEKLEQGGGGSFEKSGQYVSTNFQDYKMKKPVTPVKVKRLEEANFSLKNESQGFVSMNQVSYSPKQVINASLPESKLADLKSSHIKLGSSPEKYVVSSHQPHPEVTHNDEPRNRSYSPASIKFGGDLPSYKTNYYANYSSRPKSQHSSDKKMKKDYQIHSNVILGEENSGFISESHSTHKKVKISPTKLPFDTEKHLKSHHFDLGNDGNFYKTTAQGYGVGKTCEASDLRGKSYSMKKSNWGFGNYPPQHVSEVKKEFEWRGGSERPQVNNSEIRKSHFNIGSERNNWKSSYNGNYHWIQPVPDTNYKFSIMN